MMLLNNYRDMRKYEYYLMTMMLVYIMLLNHYRDMQNHWSMFHYVLSYSLLFVGSFCPNDAPQSLP
jgi:hypothetical protein